MAAVADGEVFLPEQQWALSRRGAQCSVRRHFTRSGERVTLIMERLQPEFPVRFMLVGAELDLRDGIAAGFVPGGTIEGFTRWGTMRMGEREGVFLVGYPLQDEEGDARPYDERAAATEHFVAQGRRDDVVVLRSGRVDLALDALENCAAEQLQAFGVDPYSATIVAPAQLLNGEALVAPLGTAYSRYLRRGTTVGAYRARLIVDAAGEVVHCHAGDSSIARQLREDTCEVLTAHARSTPARDAQGNAIPSYHLQLVRFELANGGATWPGADGTTWRHR